MWTSVRGAFTAALLFLNPPPGCGRDGAFCPDACDGMRSYVPNELVGQGFALQQLTDAVCDHMAEDSPARPLVLSLHGPPGVGKTLFHRLLAQAVYNATDAATVRARFYTDGSRLDGPSGLLARNGWAFVTQSPNIVRCEPTIRRSQHTITTSSHIITHHRDA